MHGVIYLTTFVFVQTLIVGHYFVVCLIGLTLDKHFYWLNSDYISSSVQPHRRTPIPPPTAQGGRSQSPRSSSPRRYSGPWRLRCTVHGGRCHAPTPFRPAFLVSCFFPHLMVSSPPPPSPHKTTRYALHARRQNIKRI